MRNCAKVQFVTFCMCDVYFLAISDLWVVEHVIEVNVDCGPVTSVLSILFCVNVSFVH